MKTRCLFIPVLFFCIFSFAQKQQYKTAIVAFYNLENFYDTVNNLNTNDEEFLQMMEQRKKNVVKFVIDSIKK